jgi:hypothetical protein
MVSRASASWAICASAVGDAQVGVGDDLGVDELRGGSYGGADGVEVGDVDEVDLDAELLGEDVGEEAGHARVDDAGHDDVVTGVEDGEERRVQGRHAGAEHCCCLAVVELGELLLQATLVGAVLTRVHEALVAGVVDLPGILRQAVGVGHHDGSADGAGGLVGAVPAVHRPGVPGEGVEVVLVRPGAGPGGRGGQGVGLVHACSCAVAGRSAGQSAGRLGAGVVVWAECGAGRRPSLWVARTSETTMR